ncbi:hypothetical protein [Campylobacter fetus]|uniref:hypothetical protein n=1 Tax=Campylobacter fetus TaxID=196 RepID=UPI00073A9DEF|nr:hypothetical protein [Campylobacter fetus]ALV64341.1 hypothetical protein CFTSP3_0357 [Campylobacter fetus subsp. testudinum Sp3]
MDKINLLSQQNYELLYNQENTVQNSAQTTTSDTDTFNSENLERLWKYHFTDGKDLATSVKEANDKTMQQYGMSSVEFASLSWQEKAKMGANISYSLTGYTRDKEANISIWGKLMGYDPDFSQGEIDDLKKFINESGGIGIERIRSLRQDSTDFSIDRNVPYLVDEFAAEFFGDFQKAGFANFFFGGIKSTQLLDSDLSVEEFKSQWAKHVIKIRFGLDISDEDAKNAVDIFKELNAGQFQNKDNKTNLNEAQKDKDDDKKFTPIQGFSVDNTTYKDDAISRLKKLYEIIKKEFEDGKTELEILKLIAKTNVNLKV